MTPDPSGVQALLAAKAGEARPAFTEGATGRTLTWADVAEGADAWRGTGLVPGSRVGLRVADPLAMIPAVLGAIAAGLTVAPLEPGSPPGEVATRAGTLGLAAVVADEPIDAGVPLWLLADGTPRPAGADAAGARAVTGEAGRGAALVLASSGTTGRPKLIPLTEAQLLHAASGVVAGHGLGPGDTGYSPLPLFHINGLVVGVLAALIGEHRLVVDRRFSASTFWEITDRERVTWVNLVPAIIAVLAARSAPPREVTERVRFARSASAPLPPTTLKRFERLSGIPVVETYGMTEAASQITANPTPPGVRKPGSAGRPVGVEVRVVDPAYRAGGAVRAGEVGEVELRGPSVVEHYWEPAGSAREQRPARADDGWLATGDLGYLDTDGYLWLVGRADDVINRGGEKVYPREVEEVILALPEVATAAVVGRPHPTVGEEPVAFVVGRPGTDAGRLAADVVAACEARLSRFRRPAAVEVVDALPEGTNGKIRRVELRRQLAAGGGGARGR